MPEGLSEYNEVDREGLLGAVTRQTACNRCCAIDALALPADEANVLHVESPPPSAWQPTPSVQGTRALRIGTHRLAAAVAMEGAFVQRRSNVSRTWLR